MGCPAHKVVSGGAGCALMLDLPRCKQIIQSVRKATPLPLSIKMRLGWDEQHITAPTLARIAEDCGANMITVHGRTRVQQYSGHADWNMIRTVREAVKIPVLCNGDIDSAEKAALALQITGCSGISIGRGALGNPFVFRSVSAGLGCKAIPMLSIEEIVETAVRHGKMMCDWKGERAAVLEMRKHMAWYIRGKKRAARLQRTTQKKAVH